MDFKFKRDNQDAEQRKIKCDKMRNQFPEKIPIICEKEPKSNIKAIDKTKYLVPNDLTVSQFSFMIRKRIEIKQEEAFFLLVNGKTSLTGDSNLIDIYEKYADITVSEDGWNAEKIVVDIAQKWQAL